MATALRKTKIVCTMGPNLFEKDLVKPLMLAGMDVARFNFSHDTHENHLKRYREVCRLRDELEQLLADNAFAALAVEAAPEQPQLPEGGRDLD